MTPREYIQNQLKELKNFQPGELPSKQLEDEIFRLLMSKKFRKYSVNPDYIDHIKSAVKLNIEKNEPIKLTLVFGGYKLWRLKESPQVDWAELFSFVYYANWLSPIAAIYSPGVWLDFYSDDVILEIMDNVPKKDTEEYIKSFRKLLDFIKSFLLPNLNFTLNRVGDQYDSYEDFKKELKISKESVEKELGGLPMLTEEQANLVDLNVKLTSEQANDPKWRERVFLIHEGYAKISKRRPYYRTPEKIFVITRPLKDSIAVGTTKTSVVKFWIGEGVLKKEESGFREYIFSPSQLESNKFEKVDIQIPGLDSDNFKTIRVVI